MKPGSVKCCYENCMFSCRYINGYERHLRNDHHLKVDTVFLKFPTVQEFLDWKDSVEHENSSAYILRRGQVKSNEKTYYCHRTGYFKSKGKTTNHIKKQKTCKISGHCISKMVMTEKTNLVEVEYIKTHVGHTLERNNVSTEERSTLWEKLQQGIPLDEILYQVRNNMEEELKRIDLLSKVDLHKICAEFDFHIEKLRHPDENTGVGQSEVKEEHLTENLGDQKTTPNENNGPLKRELMLKTLEMLKMCKRDSDSLKAVLCLVENACSVLKAQEETGVSVTTQEAEKKGLENKRTNLESNATGSSSISNPCTQKKDLQTAILIALDDMKTSEIDLCSKISLKDEHMCILGI